VRSAEQRSEEAQWREAHRQALDLAQRLRGVSRVFRRYAGELRYHPAGGVQGHVGQDLRDAAAALREVLEAVVTAAARWDEEVGWLRARDPQAPVEEVQRDHAAVRDAAALTRAALDVLEQTLGRPEVAALDAPYGTGAPTRVHPGAQCTWVAQRAEELATALSAVTLRKENLLRATAV
jgi:hypothetical protein